MKEGRLADMGTNSGGLSELVGILTGIMASLMMCSFLGKILRSRFGESSLSPGGNGTCGEIARSFFEKAAVFHYISLHGEGSVEEAEAAGESFRVAVDRLHKCLGLREKRLVELEESHRWYVFFNLWYASQLLRSARVEDAEELLQDQLDEDWAQEALEEDYGWAKARELRQSTQQALRAAEEGRLTEASLRAARAADAYYNLAVEKAGQRR